MNYNRRRNIFTLGDFHQYPTPTQQIKAQQQRRQNSDPFERDPFKIQSYNFRYAERPSYPLQNLASRVGNHNSSPGKRFETFFYNYDFASSVHDKENPPTNKYREFRRRKFLLDNQQQQIPQSLLQQMRHSFNSAGGVYGSSNLNGETNFSGFSAAAANNSTEIGAHQQQQQQQQINDCNQRHSQSRQYGGHVTDSSSMCTSPGLRSTSGDTIKRNMSPLQRTSINRDSLRAGTAASRMQAQQNVVGRLRSSSRSSLCVARAFERSRRMRTDSLAAGNSNSNFTTMLGTKSAGRALSGARPSTSVHSRQPLQTIHPPGQNMVTATVEQAHGTCSGCHININIKGLDSQQLGENVVIKIEADNKSTANGITVHNNAEQRQTASITNNSSALNNIYNGVGACNDIAIAKIVEVKRNSEMNANMDVSNNLATMIPLKQHQHQLGDNTSSSTFIIDKRLSKFAMRNEERERRHRDILRSSSHSRVLPAHNISPTERVAVAAAASTTALRASSSTEALRPIKNSISKERMPSLLAWRPETKLRSCFGETDTDVLHNNTFLRRIRTSYNSPFANLRRQQTEAAYAPSMPLRANHGVCANTGLLIGSSGGTGAISKTHGSTPKAESKNSAGGQAAQRRLSRLSLRALSKSKSTLLSQSSSHLDLKRSPAMIIQSRTSMKQPVTTQSRQSLKTTPLNVNINVFTDKLKLLRV